MQNEVKETEPLSNDLYLEMFVQMANNVDMEMSITLFVGGQLISGKLIGHAKYLELVSQGFKNISSTNDFNPGEIISKEFEKMRNEEIKTRAEREKEDYSPNYIHLENACIRNPNGQNYNIQGMPFRLKFKDVTGFIFGE